MIKVLLFGRLRDVAGWRETAIEPAPPTLAGLKRVIAERWPELGQALAAGAEVAFMPPMSGG